MEKEFIPYKEALALKELEFDEPCFGRYYYKESYPMLNPKSKETELVFEFGQYLKQTEVTILAPTFSQAFRWFREKHGLESSIMFHEFYFYKGKKNVYESTIERDGETYLFTPIEGFSTYEQAELACLIKLIEIVENKTK